MRILFLINNLGFGGAEIQIIELSKILSKMGHKICIGYFSMNNQFDAILREFGIKNIYIYPRPNFHKPWTFFEAAQKTNKLVRDFNPDVIHSHLELADIIGQIVSINENLPHLITFHNLHWWNAVSVPSHWRIAFRKFWLTRGTPTFIAISNSVAKVVKQNLEKQQNKIQIVTNGVDISKFQNSHWLNGKTSPELWKIISVGRLEYVKGQDILINAIAELVVRKPQIKLSLIGDGKKRVILEKLVLDLNLNNHVHFHGMRRDIPDLLSSSDIYVQPSRSEGIGCALIEALASGLPVIITDVPGMIEVIERIPGLGKIVPKEDPISLASSIESLISNPDFCRSQALLSKECAKTLDIFHTASMLLDLYKAAL